MDVVEAKLAAFRLRWLTPDEPNSLREPAETQRSEASPQALSMAPRSVFREIGQPGPRPARRELRVSGSQLAQSTMRLVLLIAAVTIGLGLMLAVFNYVPRYIENFLATVSSNRTVARP